ncbi:MAG: hypothetical protein ABEJ87_00090 [Candidatus Nanohalobium sp.]
MNQEQLRKKIQHSLREGFTEEEVRQVLRQQGIRHSKINQAFNQIKNNSTQARNRSNQTRGTGQNQQNRQQNNQRQGSRSRNSQSQQRGQQRQDQQDRNARLNQNSRQKQQGFQQEDLDNGSGGLDLASDESGGEQNFTGQRSGQVIPGLDLTDSYYRIKQQLLLARYSIFDKNDEKVLKAKGKILSLKTNIPFMRPEDKEPVFRVVSARLPNVSHNYEVRKEDDGEALAVLDRKRTLLNQIWRIRTPDDNSIVATIQNESTVLQFLRSYGGIIPFVPNPFILAPHTYQVTDVNDNQIGELEGQLSIRDEYKLNLQDSGQLDRESMIASIMAIDALEGN